MTVVRAGEEDVDEVEEHYGVKTRVTGPHQGVELLVLVTDHLQQGGGGLLLKHGSQGKYVGEQDGEGGHGVRGESGVLHQLQQVLVVGYEGWLVIT